MLQHFNKNKNLAEAARLFFAEELHIPLRPITDKNFSVEEIFQSEADLVSKLKPQIANIQMVGLVDNEALLSKGQGALFQKDSIETLSNLNQNYQGFTIFSVNLLKKAKRKELSDIVRAFNRISKGLPVVVILKFENYLHLGTAERQTYLQKWREGEKIGKVSLMQDIDLDQTHNGHKRILKLLKLSSLEARNGGKLNSFLDFYVSWFNVFSISLLNKDFYDQIVGWFDRAIEKIKLPDKERASEANKEFTVRLISRILFIWFLKELKVIDEDLLSPTLLNGQPNPLIKPKSKGSYYYKFILQNLFFNVLNRKQEKRSETIGDFDLFSEFENLEEIKRKLALVPYLNGGLFEEQPGDFVYRNKGAAHFEVPDELFLSDLGLNTILGKFKFTTTENTPDEEVIAVDPEMLGRIFENLLAVQSDDTKEAARKNAGAFYTPRPIVSYMCRSVLHRHLGVEVNKANAKTIFQKLLETKVLDPACGSGAFPMGMLEEIMNILDQIDPQGNLWVAQVLKSEDENFKKHVSDMFDAGQVRYVKKLGLIRNCLYGLDLLSYAVEITKLRCWLSLIIEQEIDLQYSNENYKLKALPNLDFRFFQKNTLLRNFRGISFDTFLNFPEMRNLVSDLKKLEGEFFFEEESKEKKRAEIQGKIKLLLESFVDKKLSEVTKEFNIATRSLNEKISMGYPESEINKVRKAQKKAADELAELATEREKLPTYFIETLVFPDVFHPDFEKEKKGFDIVIGNPPYVNTKLINKLGLTQKLKDEYGFCDDLYNHFTFRGYELLKPGGLLSYITSDTFLTLQTKENMRHLLLGMSGQKTVANLQADLTHRDSHLVELVNTPKAFAAMVDTAIFTLKREPARLSETRTVYIDLRKPTAETFQISEEEFEAMSRSKAGVLGWERLLEHVFRKLDANENFKTSHSCDGETVEKDTGTQSEKYRFPLRLYYNSLNHAFFAPNAWNSQIFEKVIKPAFPVLEQWWEKIETSREIDRNRTLIQDYIKRLKPGDITLLGLLTDRGQGLATGDNGSFVGYREDTYWADRCRQTRPKKLMEAVEANPKLVKEFKQLASLETKEDYEAYLNGLEEQEIRNLFDAIKQKFGLRIFGKGYLYRIVSAHEIYDPTQLSEEEKADGITTKEEAYVPYDKGDKEGNRWYLDTPYVINWNKSSVKFLKISKEARFQNSQFYFKQGFCWSDILNPNAVLIKSRVKFPTVNDVKSMSLYDQSGLGDKLLVAAINSYLVFFIVREFLNTSVSLQMNDLRRVPLRVPTNGVTKSIIELVDAAINLKKLQNGNNNEIKDQVRSIEIRIEQEILALYGLNIQEGLSLAQGAYKSEEMQEEEPFVEQEEEE